VIRRRGDAPDRARRCEDFTAIDNADDRAGRGALNDGASASETQRLDNESRPVLHADHHREPTGNEADSD